MEAYHLSVVKAWASRAIAIEDDQSKWCRLSDLVRQKDCESGRSLVRDDVWAIVEAEFPEFAWDAPEVILFAQSIWFETLRHYVAGDGKPDDIRRIVEAIEQLFDFPAWLGRMYGACDWAINDRALAPQIADEAEIILAKFDSNGDPSG